MNNIWICSFVQTINSVYRFIGFIGIHYHQFECRQKAKTDEAYQSQLFH